VAHPKIGNINVVLSIYYFPKQIYRFSAICIKILLWEMARETKSPRPLCRMQEFYYARELRGDNFSKP
jgi:hypothetical protein